MSNGISSPETEATIRVLAADRTRMNSQMLADVLARDKRFRVFDVEPSSAAILTAVASERPPVALLSAALEGIETRGFQVTRELRAAHPGTRVIILLDASEPSAVVEAFRSGARGVFCRTESLKWLGKCIHCVYTGQVWANSTELNYLTDALSEAMPMNIVNARASAILSKREQDVVRCVAEGLSNREIAWRLSLTEHTVKNYLFRIFDKLGVSSRVEVVLYALSRPQTLSPTASAVEMGPSVLGRFAKGPNTELRQKPPRRTRAV